MLARRRRHQHAIVIVAALAVLLTVTAASNASSSGLKVVVIGTCSDQVHAVATAIGDKAGVAKVSTFDSNAGTPSAATLAALNLVVATGDNCGATTDGGYNDPTTWGNRLATYLDHGGALLQTAYDIWDSPNTYPTGRFQSGGYGPLLPGPNPNTTTTLGTVLHPKSPIVMGLGTFPSADNTTDALAPGATLLATWADGRNAIAVKGNVVSTTAGAYDADTLPDLATLAVNTGKYFGLPDTKISKATINQDKNTARFAFKAIPSEPKFECMLFQPGAKGLQTFGACKSGKTYKNLAPGKYTFEVRAVGSIKPDPTPATKKFHIR